MVCKSCKHIASEYDLAIFIWGCLYDRKDAPTTGSETAYRSCLADIKRITRE